MELPAEFGWETPFKVQEVVRRLFAQDMVTAEEIAETKRTLMIVIEDLKQRVERLESSAREPAGAETDDPMCQCGHPKSEHVYHSHTGSTNGCDMIGCPCDSFVPAPEPRGEAIDPVLFAIAEAYRAEPSPKHKSVYYGSQRGRLLADAYRALSGKRNDIDVRPELLSYGVTKP